MTNTTTNKRNMHVSTSKNIIPYYFTQPHDPYILSSGDTLGGTTSISSTATYVGMHGCVKYSNVVEYALLVCVLCQPVPLSIHPSLHFLEQYFRNAINLLITWGLLV